MLKDHLELPLGAQEKQILANVRSVGWKGGSSNRASAAQRSLELVSTRSLDDPRKERQNLMDTFTLFSHLLQAETEDAVTAILSNAGYLVDDESVWRPLGFENNFSTIGNQQSDASAALVEKIINGIDAMLMAKCFEQGIDPEGPDAPQTMAEAVERFFAVREGRLSNLSDREQSALAENINVVAVGSKQSPGYLIIDRGEGQTPARFPDTLVSLQRSNKMRIPFVQGKFNSGGTGILQFCGQENYQLIASRRQPYSPVAPDDDTAEDWGFTLVRRMLPSGGRRSSVYVYLAPNGKVPSFKADGIECSPASLERITRPQLTRLTSRMARA